MFNLANNQNIYIFKKHINVWDANGLLTIINHIKYVVKGEKIMLFGRLYTNTSILEKALDATWLRNDTISNNIANVDTPGYKRKDVEFEEFLHNAVKFNKSMNKIDVDDIQPKIVTRINHLQTRIDGNNVDVDVEMTEMAKNSIRYNTLISQVSHEFKRMNTVLNAR